MRPIDDWFAADDLIRLGTAVGLFVLGLGLLLVWRRLRRGPVAATPWCAACWYDLTGHDVADEARCPECGAELARDGAVTFRRAGHRWPGLVVLVGAAACLLGGAPFGVSSVGQCDWRRLLPDGVLLARLEQSLDPRDHLELARRLLRTPGSWPADAGIALRLEAVAAANLDMVRQSYAPRDVAPRAGIKQDFLWCLDFVPILLGRLDRGTLIEQVRAASDADGAAPPTMGAALRRLGAIVAAETTVPHAPLVFPLVAGRELAGGSVYGCEFDSQALAGVPLRWRPELVAVELRLADGLAENGLAENGLVENGVVEVPMPRGQPAGIELSFPVQRSPLASARRWSFDDPRYIDWTPVRDAMIGLGWDTAAVTVVVDVTVLTDDPSDVVLGVERVRFELYEPARIVRDLSRSVLGVLPATEKMERIAGAMRAEHVRIENLSDEQREQLVAVRGPAAAAARSRVSMVLYHQVPAIDTEGLISFSLAVEWPGGTASRIQGEPVRPRPLDTGDLFTTLLDREVPSDLRLVDLVLRPDREAAIETSWLEWAATGRPVSYIDAPIRLLGVPVDVVDGATEDGEIKDAGLTGAGSTDSGQRDAGTQDREPEEQPDAERGSPSDRAE